MQIFVESIRARIEQYLTWAKAMKKKCLAVASGEMTYEDLLAWIRENETA